MEKRYKMKEIFKTIEKISKKIKKAIKKGDTSKSQNQNSTGDTQLKLDIVSDMIVEKYFKKISSIKQIVSEEQEQIIDINKDGKYLIAYDPLDGSSLVDVNLSVGSIYGIYENSFKGCNIIASVYVVYGPRLEMVVTYKNKVKMYRLLRGKFKFIQDIKLNQKGKLQSPGSTQEFWSPYHKKMIDEFFQDSYRLRFSGGMVPDLHHILLKGGGLFSYPATTDLPKGKIRQLFEIFPFALTFEVANGGATCGKKRILDIETTHIHDTSPCFFGSSYEIDTVKKTYSKYD
jgi:fructose-1,6-bisphosphatase I